MSVRKRFSEVFGIQATLDDERKRFVDRINQSVFNEVDSKGWAKYGYVKIAEHICYELGVSIEDTLNMRGPSRSVKRYGTYGPYGPGTRQPGPVLPRIRTLTQDDFRKTLLVICILYDCFTKPEDWRLKWLCESIEKALSYAACDLGITWKDGLFYPSGAEELDKALVEDTLTWLADYPSERKDYQRALECYLGKQHLGDVIKNSYLVAEGITRNVLGNDRTLDKNKTALLAKLRLPGEWASMLGSYIGYAHNLRHASEERHDISEQEAEAFLYLTGLIVRLIIKSM
ncbi:MAG: hypothetical protein ACYTEL_21905 [Planctomycetota bacterium]|jgi:hypothetical protein